MLLHSLAPERRIFGTPPNPFGSGMLIVPSVPKISMRGVSEATTSKLVTMVPTAPHAKSMVPVTCVGTSTATFSPNFFSLVMVRSAKLMLVDPVTRATGPSSETNAVT